MIKKSIFKTSSFIVVLCTLLLIVGSIGGAWCFQTTIETQVLEVELYDCHSVPATCYMPGRDRQEQTSHSDQSDCTTCLDVSFEELLNTVVQTRITDTVPFLAAAHYQFLLSEEPVLNKHLFPSHHLALLPYTSRATRRVLQTTVLII
ncbi:MAG: hypothetical protein ACI8ZB_003963 [Desulforhopalus sp.]|jgi:hypothetical protein